MGAPALATLRCPACAAAQRLPRLGRGERALCTRCGDEIARGRADASDARTAAAFALAALILLVPANIEPILVLEYLGRARSSTIWQGCVALWDEGMWVVAIVVFLASIAIPFAKLGAIFFLTAAAGSSRWTALRLRLLAWLETIGRWSMLDVFLLAILVALIKLDGLSTARPGMGLFFFAAVVVLTMIASSSFDARSLRAELARERSA